MSSKRDMYINRNHSRRNKRKGRKDRNQRSGTRTALAAVFSVIAVLICGAGIFYVIRGNIKEQKETRIAEMELQNRTKEENDSGKADAGGGTEKNTAGSAEKNSSNDDKPAGEVTPGKAPVQNQEESNIASAKNDKVSSEADATSSNTFSETNTASSETDTASFEADGMSNETDTAEDMRETFKPGSIDKRTPRKVKGIYVTGPRAGKESYMNDLVELVDNTELNAMVIDIKNDNGEITYNMDQPEVKELHADVNYIGDIKQLISELKEKNIYLIARIVAFKDPILAKGRPDLSLKNKDGSIFYDKSGLSWVNPYKKEVWEYLVSVAGEAALLGFDEIQFDYIRFSTDSGMKNVDFGKDGKNKSKMEAITEFTEYACENLKPLGVYVSADVYGTVIDSKIDAEIVGQNYKEMAKYLDYICPMIYPSHYQNGSYGIEHPDLKPYDLILNALDRSQTALKEVEGEKTEVRPWLQDFTATWISPHKSYGADEIRAQIQAVYDAGYEEWILWNGNNNYTEEGLNKK